MKFLTAHYRAKGESGLSLVVQHYEYAGEQICFACIGKQDSLTEGLYFWFLEEALGKLLKRGRKGLGKVEKSLRRKLKELEKGMHCMGNSKPESLAGVLCKGEELLAFERGDMRILILNQAFGKSHLEHLYEGERVWEICRCRVESDVGILLAPYNFCEQIGEKVLEEALFVVETKQSWQMQKHLCELVSEAGQKRITDAGAILVRSCNTDSESAEAWVMSSREEYFTDCPEAEDEGNSVSHIDFTWGNKLGEGAFAQVYKVQNRRTGQVYCCKKSPQIPMLWKEYCVGKSLEHPLYPKMYDFWQEKGCGYLLMEYIPGTDVRHMLERRKHFSVRETIRIGMELAEGLLYLHEWKMPTVFRDVKPENIVIRQDGRVKLLDLGCVCARGAVANSLAGSRGFAAPEQFEEGRRLDVTCDVYALARTLEAMVGTASGKGKRFGKLKKLLTICTEEDSRKRVPDMRMFIYILGELSGVSARGSVRGRKKYCEIYFNKTGFLCYKNIWERDYKTLDV